MIAADRPMEQTPERCTCCCRRLRSGLQAAGKFECIKADTGEAGACVRGWGGGDSEDTGSSDVIRYKKQNGAG